MQMAGMNDGVKTRIYSVYISDTNNITRGSGVLFYPGGDYLFVFTCAHVVKDIEQVRLLFLSEKDAIRDLYQALSTVVSNKQVFSPQQCKSDTDGIETSGDNLDLAIIQVRKPADISVEPYSIVFGEASRQSNVFIQGFPNGVTDGKTALECLDYLAGSVILNPADSSSFIIRLVDDFINRENIVEDLRGLSGSPVWGSSDVDNILLGLFTCAFRENAQLSKFYATKTEWIRLFMKERFGIVVQRKLGNIPTEDIAGRDYSPITINGSIMSDKDVTAQDAWLEEQIINFRATILDLKLRKAIDFAKAVINKPEFNLCSGIKQCELMKYLLYCYEIADLDEDFDALEEDMRNRGLLKTHDQLRQLTRSFMKKQYEKTIITAEECIKNADIKKEGHLLALAKTFLFLSKAYVEDLPVSESIGQLIDEHEQLLFREENIEDDALIYQMIGYVYGEKYHDYVKSVRLINRSYCIGFDNIVLESLGAAYYFLGVADATREDGTVDGSKIDRKALYKARECFLTIIDKADDLYWAGTVRRIGLCVYNTFVFLNDNYRILTVYPDLKKYIKQDDERIWRDIEMKHAKVLAQARRIDIAGYTHITPSDRLLLETIVTASDCSFQLENVEVQLKTQKNKDKIDRARFEKFLKERIGIIENNVRKLNRQERVPIYVHLMNIYGQGMLIFGWEKIDKLKYCFNYLKDCGDPDLLETMENFVYEFEAPLEDVIKRFKRTFDTKKDIKSWQELQHLYVRHDMMDEADVMYRELLAERKELISDEPEYAYRAYMDYITLYQRDVKDALQCYLDAKDSFKDTDIKGFWELELMVCTNTFNNPERFELERRPFVEKGLISELDYHRMAFIAYMVNLREEKVKEHNEYIRQYPHLVNPYTNMLMMQREEIQYLNWVGTIKPAFLPPLRSMNLSVASSIVSRLANENWHRMIDKQLKNRFGIDKRIVFDAWGLYILAETKGVEVLQQFDKVLISHFTVIRFLDELTKVNNNKLRAMLNYIKSNAKCHIISAGFRAQIDIRNHIEYNEIAAAIALGIEQNCLVVLGEPDIDRRVIEYYKQKIIRVNEIDKLFEK